MKGKQAVLAALVAALMMLHTADAPACGPFAPVTIYTHRSFPGSNMQQFAAGDLGVVYPTYWRRFLLVAYRYLTQEPLSASEQAAFLGRHQMRPPPQPSPEQRWRDTRAQVPGVASVQYIQLHRLIPESQWQSFTNCGEDAFSSAADTLASRVREFGADHDGIRRWVAAQDQVFSNCGEGSAIPPDPEPGLPPRLAADRRYQIAAAHFYAIQLAEAQSLFTAIAADDSSPWRGIAPYLAARCVLRRATLDPREGHVDLDLVSRAASYLRQILDDPSRAAIHPATRSLLEYAEAKTAPGQRLAKVARALSTPAAEADFQRNLTDYEYLMDRDFPAKPDARGQSDLLDWVMSFQAGEFDHALEKWRATGSVPWLLAAMVHVPPEHPAAAELRAAAAEVAPASPAWATVTHYRLHQMIELDQDDAARAEIDKLLPAMTATGPRTVQNLFLGQRFDLARNLEEALRFAPRYPVAEGWDGVGDSISGPLPEGTPETLFDSDSVEMFNQGLPLAMLAEAAASEALPRPLRLRLTIAAWTRAALLERWDLARSLSTPLRDLFPNLAPDLDRWLSAATDADRSFAAAYLLLRHPGMKPYLRTGLAMRTNIGEIDDLRDNWWCAFSVAADLDLTGYERLNAIRYGGASAGPQIAPREFLTAGQRSALAEEWAALQALDTAPNHLAAIATSYASAHRADPRSPESLHFSVRATRYGCANDGTGGRSRAAFQLLHRAYPNSDWAKKTPYWFE